MNLFMLPLDHMISEELNIVLQIDLVNRFSFF